MTKIFVGNLPETCRRTDLLSLFEKYGEVTECDIIKNYGFVHMESEQDAKAAIDGLNEYEFQGSRISVEISHSKVRQKPGMGGQGMCYRCGRTGHWSKDCPRGPTRIRRYIEPPLPPPMPGYRDRLLSRYPPPRMRAYLDPYDRLLPPYPRDYYRSRTPPYTSSRYPPEYYVRRTPPPRFSGSPYMRYDPYEYSSRGRYGYGRLTPPPMRPRVAPY